MGVKAGVSDLFLALPRGFFHGLFIEMKSKTGVVTPSQTEFMSNMASNQYSCVVCRSSQDAIDEIEKYIWESY